MVSTQPIALKSTRVLIAAKRSDGYFRAHSNGDNVLSPLASVQYNAKLLFVQKKREKHWHRDSLVDVVAVEVDLKLLRRDNRILVGAAAWSLRCAQCTCRT